MLLKDFISESAKDLEPLYSAEESRTIVLMICEEILGTKNYTHIVDPGYEIDKGKKPLLDSALERLQEGEPVQYVLGHTEFYGRTFNVSPAVLIPRPETEQLCRSVITEASRLARMRSAFGGKNVRILDLCTGSGCIAWTLALSVPGAEVIAVDISPEALDVAEKQDFKAEIKKTEAKRPSFILADVLGGPDAENTKSVFPEDVKFDIIVSNPPYIREMEKKLMRKNVCDYEPAMALFVSDEQPLIFYEAISAWSEKLLSEEGTGFVEINEALGMPTAEVFRNKGFGEVETVKDLSSKDRFIRFSK